MSTIGWDNWLAGYEGSMNDRLYQWLSENLLTYDGGEQTHDLFYEYFTQFGYTGTLPEMMYEWAGDMSGNLGSLPERIGALPVGGGKLGASMWPYVVVSQGQLVVSDNQIVVST